jgi:hypothetical protein
MLAAAILIIALMVLILYSPNANTELDSSIRKLLKLSNQSKSIWFD